MPDARPYSVSLARAIISSSLLNGTTPTTGPKISSRMKRMSLLASVITVGSKYQPRASSPSCGLRPPAAILAPSRTPEAT
jgi:hypothetical protein